MTDRVFETPEQESQPGAAGPRVNGHDPNADISAEDDGFSYDDAIAELRAWVGEQPETLSLDDLHRRIGEVFETAIAAGIDPAPLEDPIVGVVAKRKNLSVKTIRSMWASIARDMKPAKAPQKEAEPAPTRPFVEELELWEGPVDGLALAEEIRDQVHRSVVLPRPSDLDTMTLWIMGSYLMDVWEVWPKVVIHAPTRECGKTNAVQVFGAFCPRVKIWSSVTEAIVFRSIELHQPTIILDEADRYLGDRSELTGIFNAGHTRSTAFVPRIVKDSEGNFSPADFSTWAPQVFAGIGTKWLDHALRSRALEFALTRKATGTEVQELGARYIASKLHVRRQLLAWAVDVAGTIASDSARVPNLGSDRLRDNWTPLLRVANALGGEWPARCLAAYRAASRDGRDGESERALLLLADVWELMGDRKAAMLDSDEIVRELNKLETSPWADERAGKGISLVGLANLLKEFGIKPKKRRNPAHGPHNKPKRGYTEADIAAVAARFLPSPDPEDGGVSS